MQCKPIRTSNLASIGCDASSRTLEVEFDSGAVYEYLTVPASVYQGLMSTASHGQHFGAYVKKAGYPYSQVW